MPREGPARSLPDLARRVQRASGPAQRDLRGPVGLFAAVRGRGRGNCRGEGRSPRARGPETAHPGSHHRAWPNGNRAVCGKTFRSVSIRLPRGADRNGTAPDPVDRRASPRQLLGRPRPGLLRRRDDRRADVGSRKHQSASRDLPRLGDAIQGRASAADPGNRAAARRRRDRGGLGGSRGRQGPDHRPVDRRAVGPAPLVQELRAELPRRARAAGRTGVGDRARDSCPVDSGREVAAGTLRQRESRGVRRLPQGTVFLQPAERRKLEQGDRAIRRGEQTGSQLCARVLRSLGRIPLGRVQRGSAHQRGGGSEGKGRGGSSDTPGRWLRRSACLACHVQGVVRT